MVRLFARVYTQTDYQTSYRSLPKLVLDGWSVSSIIWAIGHLAVVSCDTQTTNTVNCCAWFTKRHKKAKEYSMNMQLHENSVRLWNASKVFVYKYINIKNNGLLNSFCSSILLQLESSSFWEFWVLSRWRNTRIQAPRIQYLVRFRRFDTVQTSWSRGPAFMFRVC